MLAEVALGRACCARSNMTREMRHWLPPDDAAAYEGHRYRTCAIVGNSGVARLTAYGADIDAHEAVFRMNQARPPRRQR